MKDISSSYAKRLGETNFHARKISQSGSKAEDGEKKKEKRRKKERLNVGNNNGQAMHGARKPPGPKGNKISALEVSPKWVRSNIRKRQRERPKVGSNNGQLCVANATSGGARKPPGPIPTFRRREG